MAGKLQPSCPSAFTPRIPGPALCEVWGGRADAPTSPFTCWDGPRVCPAPGIPTGQGHPQPRDAGL